MGILYYERQKYYVSAHFRYLLTTFVLIRNILIAFTTSCVSIFDISNDILYTSSFSHQSFTSSTANNADFRLTQILHVPLYFIEQKFSHEQIQHGLLFTKKTSYLPLNAKKHPYFRFESRGCFTWLKTIRLDAKAASISYILLLAALYLRH